MKREYKITDTQSYIWLALIWSYSLLWAVPPLFGWSRYSTEGYGTTCSYDYFVKETHGMFYGFVLYVQKKTVGLNVMDYLVCQCYVYLHVLVAANDSYINLFVLSFESVDYYPFK